MKTIRHVAARYSMPLVVSGGGFAAQGIRTNGIQSFGAGWSWAYGPVEEYRMFLKILEPRTSAVKPYIPYDPAHPEPEFDGLGNRIIKYKVYEIYPTINPHYASNQGDDTIDFEYMIEYYACIQPITWATLSWATQPTPSQLVFMNSYTCRYQEYATGVYQYCQFRDFFQPRLALQEVTGNPTIYAIEVRAVPMSTGAEGIMQFYVSHGNYLMYTLKPEKVGRKIY